MIWNDRRSPSSAQRGSVQFLSLTAGDPLTPGYAATKDAPRLNPEDVEGLAKIPSLPLSYRDALPLLKAMEGRGVRGENDWAGGLEEVGYYSGPTEGEAYLENIVDNKITPIWNTIGVIEGSEDPDRVIVLGMYVFVILILAVSYALFQAIIEMHGYMELLIPILDLQPW